jgi:hypothetical protein
MVFNHKLSVKNHIQGIKNLKLFLNQPIHAILSGCKDRWVSKNAYPDTIRLIIQ